MIYQKRNKNSDWSCHKCMHKSIEQSKVKSNINLYEAHIWVLTKFWQYTVKNFMQTGTQKAACIEYKLPWLRIYRNSETEKHPKFSFITAIPSPERTFHTNHHLFYRGKERLSKTNIPVVNQQPHFRNKTGTPLNVEWKSFR